MATFTLEPAATLWCVEHLIMLVLLVVFDRRASFKLRTNKHSRVMRQQVNICVNILSMCCEMSPEKHQHIELQISRDNKTMYRQLAVAITTTTKPLRLSGSELHQDQTKHKLPSPLPTCQWNFIVRGDELSQKQDNKHKVRLIFSIFLQPLHTPQFYSLVFFCTFFNHMGWWKGLCLWVHDQDQRECSRSILAYTWISRWFVCVKKNKKK